MRQIAQQITGSQAHGSLPSAIVTNPKEHNNVSVMMTRTGKSTKSPEDKLGEEYHFLEALEQMSIYVKFMKDIIYKKCTIDIEPILLTETCSVILNGLKIPMKKKDKGSVTIPCTIGDRKFKKALIDFGASVSLIALSIYRKLGIGTVHDTRMTLQFVDHLVKRSYGVVEDVLVKIDKLVLPVDFVILEMPGDEEIPLILGRPFLETGRYMIDIKEGTMTLKVYNEELKIDVRNTMKYNDGVWTSNTIEMLDIVVAQSIQNQIPKLPLERVLNLSAQEIEENEDEKEKEVLDMMEAKPQWPRSKPHRWEDLRAPHETKSNKESEKGTELKQLPGNLKYVFLDS
ncbi:uncharacterized protein LOC127080748 [Lathyrus oleraceus]|uniref:uncharacterized protein LOC127080748 n=1 Tax=Pisum sativum TaxID=3888 RepID=UPI0021CFE2FB|nr:uncharacterized protein LOC127080748 [Pisum sativum]